MIRTIKVLYFLLSILTVTAFLSSCNTFRSDKPREIIYDTIYVKMNYQGDLERAVAGERPVQLQTFYKAGQSISFKKGEIVQIGSEGIDFSRITFRVDYSDNNDSITIRTVNIEDSEVKLSSKCETIVWNDPDYLPTIRIDSHLEPQQIVITPIFDSNCKKMGYQIRYGSKERGCKKQAEEVLEQFNRCIKKTQQKKIRKKLSDVLF